MTAPPHHDSSRPDRWFVGWVISLGAGLLLAMATRAYYAFVFLPAHHGSIGEAARHVIDFEGWLAFVTSTSGIVLHAATALCFVAFVLLLICGRRAPDESSGNDDLDEGAGG